MDLSSLCIHVSHKLWQVKFSYLQEENGHEENHRANLVTFGISLVDATKEDQRFLLSNQQQNLK